MLFRMTLIFVLLSILLFSVSGHAARLELEVYEISAIDIPISEVEVRLEHPTDFSGPAAASLAATGVSGPEQNATGEQEPGEEEPDAGAQRREETRTPEPTPEPTPLRTTAGPVRIGAAQNPSQPRPSKTPTPVGIAIWPGQ